MKVKPWRSWFERSSVGKDTHLHFLAYILQLSLKVSNPIPHLGGTLFCKIICNTIRSLSNGLRSIYLAGFWHFNRGPITAKKLTLISRAVKNTSLPFLALPYFCSSSLRLRCKVRISFSSSGCLSVNLHIKVKSVQGWFVHLALLWPDLWHMAHTFPRRSWTSGNSQFNFFSFFSSCCLAVSICTSSTWRFSLWWSALCFYRNNNWLKILETKTSIAPHIFQLNCLLKIKTFKLRLFILLFSQ